MERFAFIRGEKYALNGCLGEFQNTYRKAPGLCEHRFINARGDCVNSARAVSLKNSSGAWVLQNPSTGATQPLTAAPISKRAAKMRQQRRLADLQRQAFFKQFEGGCTYMAKAYGDALFRRVSGPVP